MCAAEVTCKASNSLLILVVEKRSVCVCAAEVKASDCLLQTFLNFQMSPVVWVP